MSSSIHPFFQIKKPAKKPATPPLSPLTPSPSTPSPSKQIDRSKPGLSTFCKGESSQARYVPIEKPKFYSDTLQQKYESSFNFYGRIPTTRRDFSELARDLFHVTDKPYEKCTTSTSQPEAVDFKSLIDNGSHGFFSRKQRSTFKKRASVHVKRHINTPQELEAFMDTHFPHWQMYSSCVLLSQSVWEPKKPHFQRWCDKYRPIYLDGLVGARSNYLYLKDWLHQMKIEPLSAPSSGTPKKKRNRKKKKMVIYDNAEDEDMMRGLSLVEENDDDDDFMLTPKKKTLKKSNMKSNIILLVGDHGVGKTAAVYTIAEQLQYQVFEINSGTRRSGKDIVSMVGEMTKSHTVTFHTPSIFQAPKPVSTKKRLNPTFSPSAQLASQQKHGLLKNFMIKKEDPKKTTMQQSLILLEEVDLLFEDDKGFWASVIDLSQKSKRPIIMTCNDPDQVPFEDLCIQSVLDIQPPSETELLPYLWLVCFKEGYIVDPSDLICLMGFLGRDIRKLLTTLELYAGNQLFERYLGLSGNVDLVDLKSRCVASRLAVDTFRLARCYEEEEENMEEDHEEDFDLVVRVLENNAFIDSYLSPKENGKMVHEGIEDQLNGFTTLWIENDEETPSTWMLNDIENEVSVLNSRLVNTSSWKKLILDEGSHWQESCDSSLTNFEDYRDAIEKVLPIQLIYQPNEQIIMMEYIPQIQTMLSTDVEKKSRSTRSKRKRLYLPLNEDCVDTLNTYKPIIDETEIWIQRLADLRS